MHFDTRGRCQIDLDFQGIVDPRLVLDDLGVEPRFAKLLRDVIRGGFVFNGACHVRKLGERREMFLGKLRIGYREESRLDRGFGWCIDEAEGRRRRWRRCVVAGLDGRAGKQDCKRKKGCREESHRAEEIRASKVAQALRELASPGYPSPQFMKPVALELIPLRGRDAGATSCYFRIWPVPMISYLVEVSSFRAKGPRQWSFWVLIPISAPKPNSAPSVNRVEAFQ